MSEPETSFKTITVGIAPDAIEQIAKVPPDRAVEELIWNAIDAEATRIEVIFYENKMKGIDRIVVSDNGHGIPVEAAESIFGDIGGSPKRLRRRSPTLGRPYHGKEGKGRYKGFSIGNRVEWHSRCQVDGSLQAFSVRLTERLSSLRRNRSTDTLRRPQRLRCDHHGPSGWSLLAAKRRTA